MIISAKATRYPCNKRGICEEDLIVLSQTSPRANLQARVSLSIINKDEMNKSVGLVENIVQDPVLFCHRAGGSGVVSPQIHVQF